MNGRVVGDCPKKRLCASLLVTLRLGAILLAASASAQDFPLNTPGRQQLGPLQTSILAFKKARGRWPRDLADLRRYVQRARRRVDFSRFASLKLTPKPRNTLLVEYKIAGNNPRRGVFAITVVRAVP